VSRYWDDEQPSADEIRSDLGRERVDAWIVVDGEEPVGYLQSWWEEDEPRRGGLDGFLIPSARGRGLMPKAARALAGAVLGAILGGGNGGPHELNDQADRR